jgi:hypothetical protein
MHTKRRVCLVALLASCGADEKPKVEAGPPPASPTAAFAVDVAAPAQIDEGATATLAASAQDAQPAEKLAFAWKQVGGPTVALATPFAAATTFRAPDQIADYELRFEVAITHGERMAKKLAAVRVRADDDPPTGEIYAPDGGECGSRVVVTGQGRTLEPQELRFAWKQIDEGPRVELGQDSASQVTFVPPEAAGEYSISLEFSVSDGVNPPVTSRAKLAIACDPSAAPLAAGTTRALSTKTDEPSPLPRGKWAVSGALSLTPAQPDAPAIATLRFEYGADAAAAIALTQQGASAQLRMFGLVRDGAKEPWREPHSSGKEDLGEWPADQPLGYELEWDGQELAVHWGPPGERASWPEPPFPVSFHLASRPHALVVTVSGGELALADPMLTAR